MNEQVKHPKVEAFKWTLVALLLVSGVVLNAIFAKISIIFKLIAWVVLGGLTLLVAYSTSRGKEAWTFIESARVELRKVVWPTRKETIQTTLVTVVMVFVMSMLLWGIDSVLLWAVSLLTGQRG